MMINFYLALINKRAVTKVAYISEIEGNLQIGPEIITKFRIHIQNLQTQIQENQHSKSVSI